MASKRNVVLSIVFRILACLVVLVVAVGIFGMLRSSKPQPERTSQAGLLPRVVVMRAQAVPVRRQWDGYGTAQVMDSADVPARVMATVSAIPDSVLAGSDVLQGDLLVQLDDTDFLRQVEIATHAIDDLDAQLEQLRISTRSWSDRLELAQEQVALARAEMDRVSEAFGRGAAKQREVDQARTALLNAVREETAAREESDKLVPRRSSLEAMKAGQEAQLELARLNVDRCRIVSPLTGVLQSVDVEVGENLAVGQRVARVVDLSRIEVPLRIPSAARSSLRIGDEVILRPAGDGRDQWLSKVARISPDDDRGTRTMAVYAEVRQNPKSPDGLAPGRFIRGIVSSFSNAPRWIVPRRALSGNRIQLINDGRVAGREIDIDFEIESEFRQLGLPDVQWVVLSQTLRDGDLVVVNASRMMAEGLAVQPVIAALDPPDSGGGGGAER